jgi:hypothetical protein
MQESRYREMSDMLVCNPTAMRPYHLDHAPRRPELYPHGILILLFHHPMTRPNLIPICRQASASASTASHLSTCARISHWQRGSALHPSKSPAESSIRGPPALQTCLLLVVLPPSYRRECR